MNEPKKQYEIYFESREDDKPTFHVAVDTSDFACYHEICKAVQYVVMEYEKHAYREEEKENPDELSSDV